jgi:hypothetical protein
VILDLHEPPLVAPLNEAAVIKGDVAASPSLRRNIDRHRQERRPERRDAVKLRLFHKLARCCLSGHLESQARRSIQLVIRDPHIQKLDEQALDLKVGVLASE